jgi:hypothetical protein
MRLPIMPLGTKAFDCAVSISKRLLSDVASKQGYAFGISGDCVSIENFISHDVDYAQLLGTMHYTTCYWQIALWGCANNVFEFRKIFLGPFEEGLIYDYSNNVFRFKFKIPKFSPFSLRIVVPWIRII